MHSKYISKIQIRSNLKNNIIIFYNKTTFKNMYIHIYVFIFLYLTFHNTVFASSSAPSVCLFRALQLFGLQSNFKTFCFAFFHFMIASFCLVLSSSNFTNQFSCSRAASSVISVFFVFQ